MLDDEPRERAGYQGPPDIPDEYEGHREDEPDNGPSLGDDLLALFEDGKTYAEAELASQKSRAGYTANRRKSAVAIGFGAFGVLHLALIALTVGAVMALIPIVGPWIATAIVTIVLVAIGIVLLVMLKNRIDDIRSAFSDDDNE